MWEDWTDEVMNGRMLDVPACPILHFLKIKIIHSWKWHVVLKIDMTVYCMSEKCLPVKTGRTIIVKNGVYSTPRCLQDISCLVYIGLLSSYDFKDNKIHVCVTVL